VFTESERLALAGFLDGYAAGAQPVAQLPGAPGPLSASAAAQLPEVSAAARRFEALSAGARHAWLATHLAALRAGKITVPQLP
jgi:hypothetical protein